MHAREEKVVRVLERLEDGESGQLNGVRDDVIGGSQEHNKKQLSKFRDAGALTCRK